MEKLKQKPTKQATNKPIAKPTKEPTNQKQKPSSTKSSTNTTDATKPRSGEVYMKMNGDETWKKFEVSDNLTDIGKLFYERLCPLLFEEDKKQQPVHVSFVDFGGVAEHFLGGRGDSGYSQTPPLTKLPNAFIFSFVPPNKRFADIDLMANTAAKAGFIGTIIVTEKHKSRGKADVLINLVRPFGAHIVASYYEDTACVLDELAKFGANNAIQNFWIQPPKDSPYHKEKPEHETVYVKYSVEQFLRLAI